MWKYVLIAVVMASPLWAEETPEAADTATEPAYVEREEQVRDNSTGRVRTERVVEFKELEIEPTLARPVSFIIPRAKPDFDAINFTIYNNEPPVCVPEEVKARYYRRIYVNEENASEDKTRAAFTPESGRKKPADKSEGAADALPANEPDGE